MKNKYRIDGDIVYIELKYKDEIMETMIDLEDFEKVNKVNSWRAKYNKKINNYYVYGCCFIDEKYKTTLALHRIIMNVINSNLEIDHIHHNTLDNRKSELRIVTCQENHFNYKEPQGYSWDKNRNKWLAQIRIDNKNIFLGRYSNEQDARDAYLKAKEIYHIIDNNKENK